MKSLINYTEENQTKLFDESGAFFAFSKEQFDEKKQPGIKYVSMLGGLLCPKENVQKIHDGINSIYEKGIKQDVEENGAKAIIRREYFNYETQITQDISDMKDALKQYMEMFPVDFSPNVLAVEAAKCFQEAIDKDLF